MRPQFVSIVLFFCLVVPGVSTYAWLQYRKHAIRQEVKHQLIAGMDRSQLVVLLFHKSDAETALDWEHDAECRYQGQMYDVVEVVSRGDSFLYHCWPDRAETALDRKLAQLVSGAVGNDPFSQQSQQELQSFFKIFFCEPTPSWQLCQRETPERVVFPAYTFHLPVASCLPPTQPPDFLVKNVIFLV